MNTYDPMNGMVYLHMPRAAEAQYVQVASMPAPGQLPKGYANGSPRTYLGRTRQTLPAA